MKKLITSSLIVLCVSINAFSTNRISASSGSWATPGTWSPSGTPTSADNLTIQSGHVVTLSSASACANLTVNGGGTMQFTANVTLTISGNYTLSTAANEVGSFGQITFGGSGTLVTVTGTVAPLVRYFFNNSRTISSSSVINKGTGITQIGTGFTVSNLGNYTVGSLVNTATSEWSNGAGSTLTIAVNGFMSANGIFDPSASGNTVIISFAAGSIPTTLSGYSNLTIGGSGSKTLSENETLGKNLTINSGATLNSNNFNLSLHGNWINNGTFTPSAGHSVTFNSSTAAQTISGSGTTTFEQLTISNTSGSFAGVSISGGSYLLNDVLTMNNGNFFTNGNSFTMLSNATKTARIAPVGAGCNISGNFIVQRYITARDTTFADFSSPVQASTFQDWADELPAISYPYIPGVEIPTQSTWSEPLNTYSYSVSSTTPLTPGLGFEIFLAGDVSFAPFPATTINTIGVPNYGNQDLSSLISYSGASDGSNLVGNPFASNILWDNVYAASSNIDATFDMFDNSAGSYVDYTFGTEIGSTQGFWVYTLGAGATLLVNESAKTTTTNSTLHRPQINPYLTLKLSSSDAGNTYSHTMKVVAASDATDGYDAGKDHPYRPSPLKSAPSIYTTIDGGKSVIDVFNANDDNYDMPIVTTAGVSGNYQISVSNFDVVSQYSCIKIEDKFLNNFVDLRTNPVYSFKMNTTDNCNRFVIHFSKDNNCKSLISNTTSVLNALENHVEVLPTVQGNIINFNLAESTNTTITVINVLGQTIVDAVNVAAYNQSVNINLPEGFSGIYLVKLESSNGVVVKKFYK